MIISSRTPEGESNQCPICGHWVRLEPSLDTRDAPCPRCGHLLWFEPETKGFSNKVAELYEARSGREHAEADRLLGELVYQLGEARFGLPDENQMLELLEHSSKFEKIGTLDFLLDLNSWDDLILRLKCISE